MLGRADRGGACDHAADFAQTLFSGAEVEGGARFRVEAKLTTVLMTEASNVSAIDKCFKRFEKHDIHVPKLAQGKAPKAQPLGKEEEADRLAKTAHETTGLGRLVN